MCFSYETIQKGSSARLRAETLRQAGRLPYAMTLFQEQYYLLEAAREVRLF